MKRLPDLSIRDLEKNPVWEFVHEEETDGAAISARPVMESPISHAQNRFIGTIVTLNNGSRYWATLGNIDLNNCKSTHHFLLISFVREGKWFNLARYHDFDYATRGPQGLADFLGLSIENVFPISYDISALAVGLPEVVAGRIPVETTEKLLQTELIALALE